MKNIKVEHTKILPVVKNLIGGNAIDTSVTDAKLVLVKDDRLACEGLIRCIKEWKSFIEPETDFANVGDITIGKNWSKGDLLYGYNEKEKWFEQNVK